MSIEYGTHSCVIRMVENGKPIVAKVLTNKAQFDKELKNAHLLQEIDPAQKYIVYPDPDMAVTLLPDDKEYPLHNCAQSVEPLYVLYMKDAGRTLQSFAEAPTHEWSLEQAKDILDQVCSAIQFIHAKNHGLGDVHPGNILLSTNRYGDIRVSLIDPLNMDHASMHKDAKDVIAVVAKSIYKNCNKDEVELVHGYEKNFKVSQIHTIQMALHNDKIFAPKTESRFSGVGRQLF